MAGLFSYPKRKLRKMISAGDYAEALEFGRSLEESHGQDPDYLFIMGSAHYVLGDAAESSRYFERALEINPYDADSMLLLARLYAHAGRGEEAKGLCRRILDADPESSEAGELLDSL